MNNQHTVTDSIAGARCLSLITFKRDGAPVATPVRVGIIQ